MAQANCNDVLIETFSVNKTEVDADVFVKQVEHKIKINLGQLPAPGNDRESFSLRQRAHFASSLRGPAEEWFAGSINEDDAAHTRNFFKMRISYTFY